MIINRFYERFVRHPRTALLAFLCYPFKIKKNKVVFRNFGGKGYSDNPKYIADEIIRRGYKYDMVWLVNEFYDEIPSSIRQVKNATLKCAYEMSTAKVIIINTKDALTCFKKKNQYLIQTWHSTYGPKYVEKDALDTLPAYYIKDSMENSAETDLFLSPCKLQTEEFRHAFWCECEIMPSGIPRNDVYFNYSPAQINSVKKELGIPSEAKIIIYAPTFRDDHSTEVYSLLDFAKIRKFLEERFGGDWYVLIRLHPGIQFDVNFKFDFNDHIINVSGYSDIQELLIASTLLITDYSSIMFDFYLLKKPVFLFTPDVDSPSIRGLRPMFYEFPFVHCKTQEELLSAITTFREKDYQDKVMEFEERFHSYDDGHAAERVVDRMKEIMNKND